MSTIQQYKVELSNILEELPEEKIIDLFNFAKFLGSQYSEKTISAVDKSSLLLQQESLSKIWDSPEEDIYEL